MKTTKMNNWKMKGGRNTDLQMTVTPGNIKKIAIIRGFGTNGARGYNSVKKTVIIVMSSVENCNNKRKEKALILLF